MPTDLSKETYLAMARQIGIDMSEPAYLDALYGDVLAVLDIVSVLYDVDVDGIEPAASFGTGYGPPGKQQIGRS